MELTIIHDSGSQENLGTAFAMSVPEGFKEASFIEGKLMRIAKKKVEILVQDENSAESSLLAIKLADGVGISLDIIGEEVKAVIVDGKIALITPLGNAAGAGRPASSPMNNE